MISANVSVHCIVIIIKGIKRHIEDRFPNAF
jgi:hypothetical protein